jgi:hypothetical protein
MFSELLDIWKDIVLNYRGKGKCGQCPEVLAHGEQV